MTPFHADRAELDRGEQDAPDSGRLRVSHGTALESGIPPARERLSRERELAHESLEQLDLALVETTRAEANIGLLLRGLEHLGASARAAREANASLLQELEALRTTLYRTHEREAELAQRVESLSRLLESSKRDSEREQSLWFAQEDAFVVELMTDHERTLEAVSAEHGRRLGEIERALAEARAQRDAARTEVLQITYERDAAMAALVEPGPPTEPMQSLPPSTSLTPSVTLPVPAPSTVRSSSSSFELGALKLKRSMLAQKPDTSSRPLIGYSVGREELAEERLESPKLTPVPPPK